MRSINWSQLKIASIENLSKAKLMDKTFNNPMKLHLKYRKGENIGTIMIVDYDKLKKK